MAEVRKIKRTKNTPQPQNLIHIHPLSQMSLFHSVKPLPPDAIFGLVTLFQKDKNLLKVDLTAGIYRDEELKSGVMRAVKQGETLLLEMEKSKAYLPQEGKKDFIKETCNLVFGTSFAEENKHRLLGLQSLGGTGALRLGGDFLKREISSNILLSDPTWANHHGVFEACGMNIAPYPYYNDKIRAFDCPRLLDFLQTVPEKSIIVLHTCCHNPTGSDPTKEEWKELERVISKRKLIPFFDTAYLGFSQNLEEDSWPIRYFAKKGHELLIALSFSKTCSLYAERIGALLILTNRDDVNKSIYSVLKRLIRTNYSNPPLHGANLVTLLLKNSQLKREWEEELEEMRTRLTTIRTTFFHALSMKLGKDPFDLFLNHLGLFSLLPLTEEEAATLMKKSAIYMTKDGRINLTGLNKKNLNYVVEEIAKIKEG